MKTSSAFTTSGLALVLLAISTPCSAQQRALTAADYGRAEQYMPYNVNSLALGAMFPPVWMPDDRLWYRAAMKTGYELVFVDPARRTKTNLLDDPRLSAALRSVLGAGADSLKQQRARVIPSDDGRTLNVTLGRRRVTCDIAAARCDSVAGQPSGARSAPQEPEHLSPDGKRGAFIRNWNLWMRDVATGKETQLTHDGVENFGYATDNAGWKHSDRAILTWSPDSKKIATFQQDQRHVGEMYLVRTKVGHPTLEAWKYPLVGDSIVTMIERVIIDVGGATPTVVRFKMPQDQHRSSRCDDLDCGDGELADVDWYPDGSHLAFISSSRDHKRVVLRVADAKTGDVRDLLEETSPTQIETGTSRNNWHVLPASNEVIWYSERSNWGQLYLYDLTTGRLKRQVTTGDGNVTQLLSVDEKHRTAYVLGVGKEAGRDPYFQFLYKIALDGGPLKLLTPENATHMASLSPSGRYVVDTYSRPDLPQTTVVRDTAGRVVMTVDSLDISRLVATGWKAPVPITVKARDGKTDLYGLMYLPTHVDSARKYPIVNSVYPGPQSGSVPTRMFYPATGDQHALAELGFVVVEIDGMGTPFRSKAFHDFYYGNMGDNTLPDQVAGMKELSKRYPFIDIDRAGIYGHSGGGFATADAMFRYPDFFKVGISESGNHDNREYEDDWGERYQGLEVRQPDGKSSYDDQANQNLAKNLKGKLLLAHGTTDGNVPPYNTYLVIDALIKANKDFDLLMLPNQAHGYGAESNYMARRRWDYFVKNLLGAEPPKEYELGPKPPGGRVTP
jgi:dipeptidyl aminopeptidase/acylaminoacyl peptidase